MSVGTNENAKNINENFTNFEQKNNGEKISNIIENTEENLYQNNNQIINHEINNNENSNTKINTQENSDIKIDEFNSNEPNFHIIKNDTIHEDSQNDICKDEKDIQNGFEKEKMQETQKIIVLDEFIKKSEKLNSNFSEEQSSEKSDNNNFENTNSNNLEYVNKQNTYNIQDASIQQNLNDIPNNIQTKISQEPSTEEPSIIENNKEQQHFQDKKDYRLEKMLFSRINEMQGRIKESLELIKKFERINAKEENLPNIVTTLHDKLTQEVIKQFRTVGIEFNMKSYLVQSIVSDLLNKFEEGITEFKDCSENLNFVREVQDDFESKTQLASTSRVKNIFARLRGLFKPEKKQEKLEQLERERQEKKLEEANIHLIKYKFKNNELEKYTIKNNIIDSLTREILNGPGPGLGLSVSEFINKKVTPELEKLGLENLVSKLEDNIYDNYKQKQENNEIAKENFLDIQVSDVKREIKNAKNTHSHVNTNVKSNQDEERMVV